MYISNKSNESNTNSMLSIYLINHSIFKFQLSSIYIANSIQDDKILQYFLIILWPSK